MGNLLPGYCSTAEFAALNSVFLPPRDIAVVYGVHLEEHSVARRAATSSGIAIVPMVNDGRNVIYTPL